MSAYLWDDLGHLQRDRIGQREADRGTGRRPHAAANPVPAALAETAARDERPAAQAIPAANHRRPSSGGIIPPAGGAVNLLAARGAVAAAHGIARRASAPSSARWWVRPR